MCIWVILMINNKVNKFIKKLIMFFEYIDKVKVIVL